jgi:hypothetical protein
VNRAGVVGACAALMAVVEAGAMADPGARPGWRNVTTNAPLKPGVYGRIDVRGTPPPLVHAKAVVVKSDPERGAQAPVYLYVPPGQVRRWHQHCDKWQACDRPVYFVRVDDSPSRLGDWKKTQRPQPQSSFIQYAWQRIASD